MAYNSDGFERMAQRFVNTVYFKDELGDIHFSSTCTFVRFRGEFFTIFAAHAIPNTNEDISLMGHLGTDGKFYSITEISKGHKVYKEHDLVICNTTGPLELKNYFDLDVKDSLIGFRKNIMTWIGFPKKKATEKYHRTKASDAHIKAELSMLDDGVLKWNNARYLMVQSKIKVNNHAEIIGRFDTKNVQYKYEGPKDNAYSLKGMSGGAIFFEPNNRDLTDASSEQLFRFAGIGLEHRKNQDIKGASRKLVTGLLCDYIDSNLASMTTMDFVITIK
jgi:hypothetical protein